MNKQEPGFKRFSTEHADRNDADDFRHVPSLNQPDVPQVENVAAIISEGCCSSL